jgi:hypothetical protein
LSRRTQRDKPLTFYAGWAFWCLVLSGLSMFAFFVCAVFSTKEPITESHTPRLIVINTQLSTEPRVFSTIGGRYLGAVTNFRIGGTSINADGFKPDELTAATDALKDICDRWRELGTPDALVLIVGATDRLPLGGPTRKQYDANTGLALARAAAVRDYLEKSCWQTDARKSDSQNVILLISGPQSTPEISAQQKSEAPGGFPSDRRVDVWILSAVPYSDANAIKESK